MGDDTVFSLFEVVYVPHIRRSWPSTNADIPDGDFLAIRALFGKLPPSQGYPLVATILNPIVCQIEDFATSQMPLADIIGLLPIRDRVLLIDLAAIPDLLELRTGHVFWRGQQLPPKLPNQQIVGQDKVERAAMQL